MFFKKFTILKISTRKSLDWKIITMVQSQYSLSWESYKSSICNGFSALQQNGEFVDMTLAADGHFVKVHQVLIALASPYLKELITSAPCQHPVIFLNNVSHKTLCLLLEYIYTGEVLVPAENLSSFVDTAKSLFIKGLMNMKSEDKFAVQTAVNMPQDNSELCHVSGIKSLAVPTDDGTEQIKLPASAKRIFVRREKQTTNKKTNVEVQEYSDVAMDDSGAHDSDDGFRQEEHASDYKLATPPKDNPVSNLQFSVSIRGSLQVILNRYIYNLHSSTHRAGLRRWRCVDYRNNKCTAFLVTKGNIVLNRANLHNHPFHDKKILAKIEKKSVFSALSEVETYKEKECGNADNYTTMEQDDYAGLEYSGEVDDISNVQESLNTKH